MKNDLPQFSQIDPHTVESTLKQLIHDNCTAIDQRLAQGAPFRWDDFMEPFEALDDRLNKFWTLVGHLNAVVSTPELRKAYNESLPKLSNYGTALAHNQLYYEAVKSLADSKAYKSLDFAQMKVIEHDLRDFELAGATLSPEKKKIFSELSEKLSRLSSKFEENTLDATDGWTKRITNEKDLAGLTEFAIKNARNAAKKQKQTGWLFTLNLPSYLAIMLHADSRDLRKEMYTAFVTRASDQGPNAGQWDNSEVMLDLLKTRLDFAKLLGFNNYAEYSIATKMIGSTKAVLEFLNQIVDASLEKAKQEFKELKAFADTTLGIDDVQAWDIPYVSEKLRLSRYDISQKDLRPYFPEYKVVSGLFEIVKKLFQITIKPIPDADTWHPDAKCYAIHRNGELVSYFYFDLYSRKNKRGGAWMNDCRIRRKLADDSYQIPIAFVVCNFNAPVEGNPALFTHEEVLTLFHEFGHALQQMLTKIDYANVSGINGVPWDAVEVASQFMENYAWEKQSLMMVSEHYQTKAPLPDELFDKMIRAKNFQCALQTLRQLEFALFDFCLHLEFDPAIKNQIQQILDRVRNRISVFPAPKFNRFQHAFSHIFGGGYAAGYYSYKWAEVMAHDAFSLFKEKGIFDKATSAKFLHTFLEMGGAKEPLDLFIEFRGRKPNVDALLIDNGIVNA